MIASLECNAATSAFLSFFSFSLSQHTIRLFIRAAFISLKFKLPAILAEDKQCTMISTTHLKKLSFDMYSLRYRCGISEKHSDLAIVLPKLCCNPALLVSSSSSSITKKNKKNNNKNKKRGLSFSSSSNDPRTNTPKEVTFCVHRVIIKARCPSLYSILCATLLKKQKAVFVANKTMTKNSSNSNSPPPVPTADPISYILHLKRLTTPNYKVKIKLPVRLSCSRICTPQCFQALLVFIYSGRLPLSSTTVVEIYSLAHYFKMDQVLIIMFGIINYLIEPNTFFIYIYLLLVNIPIVLIKCVLNLMLFLLAYSLTDTGEEDVYEVCDAIDGKSLVDIAWTSQKTLSSGVV